MAKSWNLKTILHKIETTEGTDAAPVVGTDAIRVLNYQPTFLDADQKVRNLEKAYFGADPATMAALRRGATFDMDMAGAGTATGVPPWMAVMRSAGFAAPSVGGSSVTLAPTSTIASATFYAWLDTLQLIAIGCKTSVGFKIEDDEFPVFSFDYLGRPPAAAIAVDSTPGAISLPSTYQEPLLSSTENTTFLLDTFALPLRRWTMNSNSDRQYRSLIGPADRINFADRAWSGEIVCELPDVASKNYFPQIKAGTTMVGNCVQGTAAGNIVTINCPKLQCQSPPSISEEQGKVMMTIPVTALPASGNDEISFVSS